MKQKYNTELLIWKPITSANAKWAFSVAMTGRPGSSKRVNNSVIVHRMSCGGKVLIRKDGKYWHGEKSFAGIVCPVLEKLARESSIRLVEEMLKDHEEVSINATEWVDKDSKERLEL